MLHSLGSPGDTYCHVFSNTSHCSTEHDFKAAALRCRNHPDCQNALREAPAETCPVSAGHGRDRHSFSTDKSVNIMDAIVLVSRLFGSKSFSSVCLLIS